MASTTLEKIPRFKRVLLHEPIPIEILLEGGANPGILFMLSIVLSVVKNEFQTTGTRVV